MTFQSKKALIDERYHECDPAGVNADLTEYFDVNANNWDFDAFERHKQRIQSSEFDSKVRQLVNNYKREQRLQNEKAISAKRDDIMAMERIRKIRSINYWDDYKAERNRLIDVAVQLQRTKFLVKRLLALLRSFCVFTFSFGTSTISTGFCISGSCSCFCCNLLLGDNVRLHLGFGQLLGTPRLALLLPVLAELSPSASATVLPLATPHPSGHGRPLRSIIKRCRRVVVRSSAVTCTATALPAGIS